ncbi:MAG: hypothetical protein HYX38_08725 [Rhodospirillales bacterium]|nr:hypothetical protein [Rhodospirillales bacterium]
MSADWPTTGAIPVFHGNSQKPELAGYTTLILEHYPKVTRFMMSRQNKTTEIGAVKLVGEAVVIERQTPTGAYLAWLVVKGDPRDMPEFWPV